MMELSGVWENSLLFQDTWDYQVEKQEIYWWATCRAEIITFAYICTLSVYFKRNILHFPLSMS